MNEKQSGGDARIAALREILSSQVEYLFLDEPTNDLDRDARRWLRQSLRNFRGALLVVSHDPEILDNVDEIWELRTGVILRHPPGYAGFMLRLEEEEIRLGEEIRNLQAEKRKTDLRAREIVERQQKRMAKGAKAGVKSNLPKIIRGMKKRQAENTLARVEGQQARQTAEIRNRLVENKLRLRQIAAFEWDPSLGRPPEGKCLLKIQAFRLSHFRRDLSFEMIGPRRIWLRGKNASGKSTLLRALAGEAEALSRVQGKIESLVPLRLFDQHLSQFQGAEALWTWFQKKSGLEIAQARTVLGRLGFQQSEQERPLSALSGGERVRIEMAVALHAPVPPSLLLLDEPTNHLDLESRRVLDVFLRDFQGGMVVVSHDENFCARVSFDEIIDLDAYL